MKFLVRFCLLAFIIFCGHICKAAYAYNGKSLLWRISGKNMAKPSYLFGTIHLICPQDYLWTPAMEKALRQADAICFEMDLDDPSLMLEISDGMINKSGKRLQDYFLPEDFEKLERFVADSLGMNIRMFQQLKPAALQALMGSNIMQCDSSTSYEAVIMEEAKHQHKEILGLEKPSEQLDLFDNLPVDSVVKDLMEIINNRNEQKDEYHTLITAYKNQDLPALHTLIQESAAHDMDIGGFIDVRNEKWIDRMVLQMDQRSILFAVGAGHLWGKNGVIKLLEKAGYTLEPVR